MESGDRGTAYLARRHPAHLPTASGENPHFKTTLNDTLGGMLFHTTIQLKSMLCALKNRSKKSSRATRKKQQVVSDVHHYLHN